MATKKVKTSVKRDVPATPTRTASPARAVGRRTPDSKPEIKDPVGRFMHEHWGALGKDYKLDY